MLNISSNIPSLNAQRTLMKNSKALNLSFQRLSTGLRINSAKDDAAGLSISNKMTGQIRGLNQAVRNANDATSLAQTAEAALNEQGSMLQRLRELAVQAASDTYTAQDRRAIQEEADALVAEIDRIATQTAFNDRKLLDGSLSDVKFQVGAFESENIGFTIASARSFDIGTVYTVGGTAVSAAALTATDLQINGVAIGASTDQSPNGTDGREATSALAKAVAINSKAAATGVTAEAQATAVTSGAAVAAGVNDLQINGVDVDVTSVANDTDFALRNAINAVSAQTGVVATLDASDQLVLTAADGRNITVADGGADAAANAAFTTTYGTIELTSDTQFSVGGDDATVAGLTAGASAGTVSTVNVSNLDFSSQDGANTAIGVLDLAIKSVSSRQSDVGALLNRMDAAVAQLSAASENLSAARGRVRDADFAAETATFSKNQILQQASTAMLAQANVANQIALTLLG